MATNIGQIKDAEAARQKRNLTDPQKKNIDKTKEGVVVNNFVKNPNMDEIYDSLIISSSTKMPEKLNENQKPQEMSLLPISAVTVGVMAGIALISALVKHSAKINLTLDAAQKLPSLSRNHSINEETHQAIYQMIQCPGQKTTLAGIGVLAISAMGFMGKMFIDGFKEIWVKKQEANIEKNLQENLIAVETQSFSGKIQIIRSMMAQKAQEFKKYICDEKDTSAICCTPDPKVNFKGKEQPEKEQPKENNSKYFALGALTLGAIAGLGFLTLRNLTSSKKHLEKYIGDAQKKITEIVKKSSSRTKEADKTNLKNMFQAIDAKPEYVKSELAKLNWNKAEKEKLINDITFNLKKSTADVDKAIGGDGTPKPTFYSHVNDYRAFFYDYLIDSSNPLFRNLFFGITGITALSYGGKVAGEAIKEVEVKKTNAQTELELQQKLVSTELRNFKAKKDAAIDPLCEEFYTQVDNKKPKEELKTMAENILFEIKNGPPFVYS